MYSNSSWGATALLWVPLVVLLDRSKLARASLTGEAGGVETPIKVDCLTTTLAHRTRKFES
ncbi:MAG: hypothetical protein V7L14_18860 [Nostoc sp.]|uniref:hypothetical protein n=1 Tax=unclassified Nostoc TaxID=2593658 RepID=UPI0025CDE783|nr:hypothetical protein [Nostoc sp. NOS(2021)]MBN3899552.1 hypothetical protein [Nostoc sp. NOS(2021)]